MHSGGKDLEIILLWVPFLEVGFQNILEIFPYEPFKMLTYVVKI